MSKNPLHCYMMTYLAVFRNPEGIPGSKHINLNISRAKKNLPLGAIKAGQDAVAQQLAFFGVEPENIVDVTFLYATYLGHMTEKELHEGLSDAQSRAAVDMGTSGEPEETFNNPFEAI